jgi:hypothetical protein
MNTYDETRRDSSCDAFIVTSYDVCNPGFGKLKFARCLAAAGLNTCPRWRNADAILGTTAFGRPTLVSCEGRTTNTGDSPRYNRRLVVYVFTDLAFRHSRTHHVLK